MSRIYLCAYFPEWSIDVTRRKIRARNTEHDPHAVLLTTTESHKVVIARCCRHSALAGVRTLMSLSLAEALIPGAYIEPFDPLRDYNALHTLAVWCLRFSPGVGLDNELTLAHKRHQLHAVSHLHYGLTIDLTGTEKLHGDIDLFCNRLDTLFQHRARIAAAPTFGGAWALSRFARATPTVARSIPALTDAFTHVPVQALRIDPVTLASLSDIGIYTLGELLDLPRHTLARRFGKNLVHRLHQTLGSHEERLTSVEAPTLYERRKTFEPPLTHRHGIVIAIEALFNDLLRTLRSAQISARSFSLTIHDTTSQHVRKEFPLSSATNDAARLLSILQPIIDSMRFCGEVREITLRAHDTVRSSNQQKGFSSTSIDASDLSRSYADLLNTFSIRIGKDRVSLASLNSSYIPERSFSYQSAIGAPASHSSTVMEPPAPYSVHERPPTLFLKPERITTIGMLPDKPPSRVRWREAQLPIISGYGPERIAPEWWRGNLQQDLFSTRDYFTVQDATGRWLWIFRDQRTQEWFVHGTWT